MKSKFILWLEHVADAMFSELGQAKALIVVFGILGVAALVGSFWNPWQLVMAGICAVMVLCGISEYKEYKK